jgi:hypothetical protein
MANWESLRRYIKGKYRTNRDDLDVVGMLFDVDGGRSQQVLVRKMSLGDEEWAEIATIVCRENQIDPREALRRNGDMVVGGLALVGDLVIFRHSFALADLDPGEFETPLSIAVGFGDQLERELSGGDAF